MEKGDRVIIYMPMIPEALEAMPACARLGAIHSVVFGGFAAPAAGGAGPFEAAPCGFVHVDLRHLARLGGRSEYVFIAIERVTRFAWVEINPDRAATRVAAAMDRFIATLGRVPHTALTDNGSELTDRFDGHAPLRSGRPSGRHAFDRLCAAHGIEHRLTRPFTPKTNGMVERFNHRLGEAVSGALRFRDAPHRRAFESSQERAASLRDFVTACNHPACDASPTRPP